MNGDLTNTSNFTNSTNLLNANLFNKECSINESNKCLFYMTTVRVQFLCCTPLHKIVIFDSEQNVCRKQKEILKHTVDNDLLKKYPVKRSYQRAFLKLLMNKIEQGGGKVHDDLYTAYCDLISTPQNELIHYRHFFINCNDSYDRITLQESTNIISEGTTGLCCWQGALELGKWCIENKPEFRNKVILELGCGVGLTGLSVIKNCSPNRYIFTDCHKSVLEMVCTNVKLNLLDNEKIAEIDRLGLQTKYNNTDIEIVKLNWEHINEYLNEHRIVPDVIIGADILYEPYSFNALVLALKAFLFFNNRYAIIAGTIRNADTFSLFLHTLEIHDLSYEECNTPKQTVVIQATDGPIKILRIFQKR
ncbi:protein-lysine N-methyltransferase EEF2KMT [Augochlora pura]